MLIAAPGQLNRWVARVTEPGAVATGSKTQGRHIAWWFLSPAKAGSGIQGDVVPGLRSLTRGYILPPLRGSLTPTNQLEFMLRRGFFFLGSPPKPTGGRGGGRFLSC